MMLTFKSRMQKWNELVENEQRNENRKKFLKNKDDLVVNERRKIQSINKKKSIVNDRIINLQGHQNDEIKFGNQQFKLNSNLNGVLLNNKLSTNENQNVDDISEKNNLKNTVVKQNNLEKNTDPLPSLVDYKLIKTTSDSSDQILKSIKLNSHDSIDNLNSNSSSRIDQKFNQINQINFNRKTEPNNQLISNRNKFQNIKNFKRSVSDLSNVILRKNYPPKNQLINENDLNNCSNQYNKNSINISYKKDLKFKNFKLINELDTSFSSGKDYLSFFSFLKKFKLEYSLE